MADAVDIVDAVARALIERARPADFRLATSAADIALAQRLRGQALIEHRWASDSDLVDGREVDADDDGATHVLAFLDGAPIGTTRLVFPTAGGLLPMERRLGTVRVDVPAVEVGRIAVVGSSRRQGRAVMAGLIGAAWLELRANGYERICGTVSAAILRMYRALGFVVRVIGPPVEIFGEQRFPILFEANADAATTAAEHVS